MDKQKVLHALRGLEMTFEQKQELVNALAESESAGGGGKVVIDVTVLAKGIYGTMDLTDEEYEAILNRNCEFIVNDDEDGYCPLIIESITDDRIELETLAHNYVLDPRVLHDTKQLRYTMPS